MILDFHACAFCGAGFGIDGAPSAAGIDWFTGERNHHARGDCIGSAGVDLVDLLQAVSA